jgi:hypothetical protein
MLQNIIMLISLVIIGRQVFKDIKGIMKND